MTSNPKDNSNASSTSANRNLSDKKLYGAIEAGGTKFLCAVGSSPDDIIAEVRIETDTPEKTFAACLEFFKSQPPISALGICSFGPLDLDKNSPTYGSITATPKPHWSNAPMRKVFEEALKVPVVVETDVNGAALAESLWGAGKGLNNIVYFTVGTGIGGGIVTNGNMVHGLVHPEMGHFLVRRHPEDKFPGRCPFHRDCLEGMASGPAIKDRWGVTAGQIGDNELALDIEGYYLAQGAMVAALTVSPQRIIFGGGVMNQSKLFPIVRRHFVELLQGYIASPAVTKDIDQYIVPCSQPQIAIGLCGAFAVLQP